METVRLNCAFCTNPFERACSAHRGLVKKKGEDAPNFCSPACYRESLNGRKRVERLVLSCDHCGNSFERRKTTQQRLEENRGVKKVFCSRSCKHASMCADLPECIVEEYSEGASLLELAKQYKVSNSSIKEFLSRRGVERRAKTARWTPEFRRQMAYSQVQNGFTFLTSGLEDEVAASLTTLGVSFERQKLIKGANGKYVACVDFWMEGDIALEVNGTFWHSDPRRYPNGPIYESQKAAFKAYPKKLAALEALEVRVVEIWELDFKAEGITALKSVLESAGMI